MQININEIMGLLPHRYPFLLVDRIEEVIDTRYDFVSSPDLLKYFSEKVHADIFYLGIGLEPLNLKAEMMSLMIVDFQMSSLFDGCDSVEDLFKDRKETDEGGIRVVPFREEFIDHYANSRKSFTTFREMLRIVRQDFDSAGLRLHQEPQGRRDRGCLIRDGSRRWRGRGAGMTCSSARRWARRISDRDGAPTACTPCVASASGCRTMKVC